MTEGKDRTGFWFRPRRYGHGATPTTWQGWATIAAFPVICVAVVLACVFWLASDLWRIIVSLVFMAVAVPTFISFVRKKTDGEWRWREGGA